MKIGPTIKELRIQKEIKQGDLANSIGISQTSLSLIESGVKQPSQDTLRKVCELFEIPQPFIYYLALEESDIPENKKELYKTLEMKLKMDIKTLFI
jgi:XRE family transcriptional regulator, regulator of sulfur utilization